MRIVGVDLSLTKTGLCRIDITDGEVQPEDIRCSVVLSKPGSYRGYAAISQRLSAIHQSIYAVTDAADVVVIEGPALAARNGQTHTRDWLWGKVYDRCLEHSEVLVATPSQRAKYVTGKGNAAKDTVLACAIRKWPNVNITGNDEADALILAAIGCRHVGHPIDSTPKANWPKTLDASTQLQ